MNLNKFAKEVHQNAVDHGFWEDERDITETGIDCNSWQSIVPTGR